MKLGEIVKLLDAKVLCGEDMELEIHTAFASDMMSDVLAFVKEQGMLITGLINPQSVRTAEMLDIHCVCFVRGKQPGPEVVELAANRDITIISTDDLMFTACGKLYRAGIK